MGARQAGRPARCGRVKTRWVGMRRPRPQREVMCKRRRCPFCGCLFHPNPRVKTRQRACSSTNCQRLRRQQTQRRWREKNLDDGVARRLRVAIAAAKTAPAGKVPKLAEPRGLPWEELRDEIRPEVYVIVVIFVRLALAAMKDAPFQMSARTAPPTRSLPGSSATPSQSPLPPTIGCRAATSPLPAPPSS